MLIKKTTKVTRIYHNTWDKACQLATAYDVPMAQVLEEAVALLVTKEKELNETSRTADGDDGPEGSSS